MNKNLLANLYKVIRLALLSLFIFALTPSQAAVVITISEVSSDVVVSGTGTANLAGLSFMSSATVYAQVEGKTGTVFTGIGGLPATLHSGITGPVSFGTGNAMYFQSAGSGDLTGVTCMLAPDCVFYVPNGYVSGAALAGNSTHAGQSLASLGLTNGVFEYSWASDTLTVIIGLPNAPVLTSTACDGQVQLSWTTPSANGPALSGYTIRYRPSGGTWSNWPHSGTGTTATVTGLINGTNYELSVAAVNSRGTGATATATATPYRPPTLIYPSPVTAYTTAPATITPTVSSVTGALTFAVVGALPAGLSIDSVTGVITGTTTADSGVYSVTVQLSQGSPPATVAATLTINVIGSAPNPTLIYPDYVGTVGDAVSLTPTTHGVTPSGYALAAGSKALPTGLSLNPSTGVISGTPTTAVSNLDVNITVSGTGGPVTSVVLFTIKPTLTYTPAHGTVGVAMQVMPTVNPLGNLTPAYTYSGSLPAGLSLDPATGIISGIPTTAGTILVPVTLSANSPSGNLVVSSISNIAISARPTVTAIPSLSAMGTFILAALIAVLGLIQVRCGPRRLK